MAGTTAAMRQGGLYRSTMLGKAFQKRDRLEPMPSFMPPKRVRNLPFNMLRSGAYPAAPWVTQQGVEDTQAGASARVYSEDYMPQKTAFNKYKTPPAGYNTQSPGASVLNMIEGREASRRMVQSLRAAGLADAVYALRPMAVAADPYNDLPSAIDFLDMDPQPIGRGILQRPDLQHSTDMREISRRIAEDPIGQSQVAYGLPRGAPPRFPDTYRVRRY